MLKIKRIACKALYLFMLSISQTKLNLHGAATIPAVDVAEAEFKINFANIYQEMRWGMGSAHGSIDEAKEFIKQGGNINVKGYQGFTALMIAAKAGSDELVKILIEAGANAKEISDNGSTALILGAGRVSKETIKLLIDSGADVHAVSNDGTTAIHQAAVGKNKDVIRFLIDLGVNVNAVDLHGNTALTYAALDRYTFGKNNGWSRFPGGKPDIEIVHLLLDAGAELDLIDKDGKKVIDYARENDYSEVVKLLENEPARRKSALLRRTEIIKKLNETKMPLVLVSLINSYLPNELAELIYFQKQ